MASAKQLTKPSPRQKRAWDKFLESSDEEDAKRKDSPIKKDKYKSVLVYDKPKNG